MGNTTSNAEMAKKETEVAAQIATLWDEHNVVVAELSRRNRVAVIAQRNAYKAHDNMVAANNALHVAEENQKREEDDVEILSQLTTARLRASVMSERYEDANTALENAHLAQSIILELAVTVEMEAKRIMNDPANKGACVLYRENKRLKAAKEVSQ